jgi:hypothetical protein
LWEQKMVAKDTSYGSETHRPYLDIERIINVQSACSVNRGHDQLIQPLQKNPTTQFHHNLTIVESKTNY